MRTPCANFRSSRDTRPAKHTSADFKEIQMNIATNLGGAFTFPGTPFTVHRMGYGAMQLAGKGVFGPPRIREALHPYRDDLVIVTKVGSSRGADASWNGAIAPDQLSAAVESNLRNLGL